MASGPNVCVWGNGVCCITITFDDLIAVAEGYGRTGTGGAAVKKTVDDNAVAACIIYISSEVAVVVCGRAC